MEHFLRISLTAECNQHVFSAFTNSNCFSSTVDVVEQALKLCEIEVVDAVKFRMLAVSQFHSQEMFWT